MKLISQKSTLKSVSATAIAAMMLLSGSANAADPIQCKGLENNACITQDTCSWVAGYERKDGRKVSAFCRTKAKSKPTSAATAKTNEKSS